MTYVILALANFAYIFLKAWQQRNVAYLHYGWAAFTNAFLVGTEMFVVGNVAVAAVSGNWHHILLVFVAMTIGGGSGCTASMWLHQRYLKPKA